MRAVVVAARQAVLIAIALMSLIAGAAFLWGWLDRETVASASAVYLVAVLAMILLPIGVVLAIEVDRRARRNRVAQAAEEDQRLVPVTDDDASTPIGIGRWRALFDATDAKPSESPDDASEALRHEPGAGATRRHARSGRARSRAASRN